MALFRHRYHPPGTAPGTLTEHPIETRRPLFINLIEYDAASLEQREDIDPADCTAFLDNDTNTWIHVQGHPDIETLNRLAELFRLHPLAIEDIMNAGQRPKLELYDQQYFMTLALLEIGETGTVSEQVSLFMGEH